MPLIAITRDTFLTLSEHSAIGTALAGCPRRIRPDSAVEYTVPILLYKQLKEISDDDDRAVRLLHDHAIRGLRADRKERERQEFLAAQNAQQP